MAKKITIAYIIIGCIWIVVGDFRLEEIALRNNLNATQVFYINIMKGLGYVLLTGLALYLYSNRSFNKLSKLEKQYRNLFEKNPNPMWVYDLKTLKFLAVNQAALKTYGYTEAEMLKLTILDIRPERERQKVIESVKRVNEDISNSGVYTHKRKNGDLFFVNIYSAATIFGNKEARMVLALDVNEKALAEQQIIKLSVDLSKFKSRLNEILSSVNDVVWACTAKDYKILFISNACKKVYGHSPDEFYENNRLWFDSIHPDDRERMEKSMEILFETGTSETEYRVIDKYGEEKIVLDKSSLTYDEHGSPKEIHGVATDITGLRRTEQNLASYTQNIARILDAITDGFVTINKSWNFTYVNKVFQKITNKTQDELLGKNIWELYPQLQNTTFQKKLLVALEGNETISFETRYFEDEKWYVCNVYPNPTGLAIYFADVTEARQMHDEIVKTKNNLNSLINNTTDLIWSVDNSHKIISANQAFKNFAFQNYKVHISEGVSAISDVMPEAMYNEWTEYYKRGLMGEAFTIEYLYQPTKGQQLWYEIHFNPIESAEHKGYRGLSCFARDITERKNYELRIEEQNKKLMEIAWMQSHEVRAPLSTIMALMDLFNRNNVADPENLEILRLMDIATKKLDEVVHEIVGKTYQARVLNNFVAKETETD